MFNRILLLTILTIVPLPGSPGSRTAPVTPVAAPATHPALGKYCQNYIPHEPLLIYEVRGGTLMGPYDRHLVLYSDGTARLSDASDPGAPEVVVEHPGVEAVFTLCSSLERCGALQNCDTKGVVTDVPLHTLTLLRGSTDAVAHTYSWWLPEGANAATEQVLDQFLADYFLQRN